MKTNIQRWGNSLGVRIPNAIVKRLALHPGVTIEIKVEDNHIVIYPRKYSLSDLLNQITEENIHKIEWSDDTAKGEEEW